MIRVETSRGSFNLDPAEKPWNTATDVMTLVLAIHNELWGINEEAAKVFLGCLAYKSSRAARGGDKP